MKKLNLHTAILLSAVTLHSAEAHVRIDETMDLFREAVHEGLDKIKALNILDEEGIKCVEEFAKEYKKKDK